MNNLVKEYLKNGGVCPNCKAEQALRNEDASLDEFSIIFEYIVCDECGKRFTFTYTLTEIISEEE